MGHLGDRRQKVRKKTPTGASKRLEVDRENEKEEFDGTEDRSAGS